jgi:serine/threonine-protein kinase
MRPGDQIRDYVLERRIGVGGMGEVWRAHHRTLRRPVAIKIIREDRDRTGAFRERFAREAQAMASLDHPHIVPVRDFFVASGVACLVMGLIDGGSLEGKGPVPLEVALRISRDVLDALNHAHQKGVIHRDIKPSNILLDRQGQPFITDFGIALVAGTQRITRLSRSGTAVGTPEYMSPEQIKTPDDIDHRTDVYSFGCVLYEMLSGQPPFGSRDAGTTEFELMQSHVTRRPVPIRQRNPGVDSRTEAVVQCALAKDREKRFAGCGDMALALAGQQAVESDEPTQLRLAQLLFSFEGRLTRLQYFKASVAVAVYFLSIWFAATSLRLDDVTAISIAILILLGVWVTLAIAAKRLHDRNRSAWWLLTSVLILPLPWLAFELWLLPGTMGTVGYGADTPQQTSFVPSSSRSHPRPSKRSSKSIAWSLRVSTKEEAQKAIGEAAKAFYLVAGMQALASIIFGSSSLIDGALFAGLSAWLHKKSSRTAATLLASLSALSIGTTVWNAVTGALGGQNVVVSLIVFWAGVRAVVATYKLPALSGRQWAIAQADKRGVSVVER